MRKPWPWRQGGFAKKKDDKWELKGKIWQPVLKEEHILNEIRFRFNLAKVRTWRVRERIPGIGHLSDAGIPDLFGFIASRAFFIEVKRPGGVHRPAQEEFITFAKLSGCIAFFAESWEDVRRELGIFGIRLPE